ncbi:sulfurtransferase complex subunit TusB [Halomonas sp. SSL-5]|uniref:sulfurtransferase complex subunit TusB n=1 Tax=Halomonas sp. SSL-5 TaxID=3065855 RepID=UPI0027396433|nr:sulfurtransferase complex subunit TusB [Halomonas sp. SSL-5]MDY7117568.1 sulfurtransferase complex subunit TusB [Halomonas sp. SSL-5]
MLLHTLNRSPLSAVLDQALAGMGPDDRLLLIEDGVIGALPAQQARFESVAGRLYALHEDLESRGLLSLCAPAVRVVDIEGFVALTEECERAVSWY